MKKSPETAGEEAPAGEHNRQVRQGEAQGELQPGEGEADQEGAGALEDKPRQEAAAAPQEGIDVKRS